MRFKSKLFLLSESEYLKYSDKLMLDDFCWCWLRTPADDDGTKRPFAKVAIRGTVIGYYAADSKNVNIRPACYVRNIDSLPISGCGRVFMGYLGRPLEWTVLDRNRGLLVSRFSFGTGCFDASTNQYADSDVNQFLQSVYGFTDNDFITDALIDGEISQPLWKEDSYAD